ncbi:MAG: bifunctional diaminohydroxyphosphoribosylaminopyrimidine deaminase/5-amino-6-(5-phosphoribosylamino)uracil reductase RibD [Candidatus Eremiobacteraeota bacterium]|nr:bifunctional diaminohydroxyphosphoribosylaminopyrimidine deaminase/5-amino-6-(5-phosphoribosylamino)uracil reductase RibD [Candidatus Eremiobacteraeota bacterium]
MASSNGAALTALDRLYLSRAYELAARGIGSTTPNPPVGAVVVATGGRIVGEGYHHRAGEPHAETNALAEAGEAARGATMYVSLEPCNHRGKTPPCAPFVADAGIARVVIGAADPNPKTDGRGIALLRERGVAVELANDPRANELIEIFAHTVRSTRPYVAVKMAMTLDGVITSQPGVQEWLTSEEERAYVRELRIAYDAVMVGAGTVRVDDPQLTVRPAHARLRPYRRIVVCESSPVPPQSRVFAAEEGYDQTIVLDVKDASPPDLAAAIASLRERGVYSVLCEGGPTLAGRLIAGGLVDRVYWAIAPLFLSNARAVPVLAGADLAAAGRKVRFDRIEHVGPDVVVSGKIDV